MAELCKGGLLCGCKLLSRLACCPPSPLPSGRCFLQVINDIRNRTGARVNLFDEEKNCGDRLLQILSTEDVQDQHCAGFDAAMDCVQVGGLVLLC